MRAGVHFPTPHDDAIIAPRCTMEVHWPDRQARNEGMTPKHRSQASGWATLTRAALTIANAARDILVAQEGAFGTHLLEHDVIDAPIMFGAGGILDASQLPTGTGFGLKPVV